MRKTGSFSVIGSDEQDLLEKISKDLERNKLLTREEGGFSETPPPTSSLKTVERIALGRAVDKRIVKVMKAEMGLGDGVAGNHALNVQYRRVDAQNNPITDKVSR